MRFSNFVSDPNDVEKIRGFNCIGLRLEDLQLTASNILYCVTIVILILFCSNTNCKLARVVSPTLNANFFLCVGGVIPCTKRMGIMELQCCNYGHLLSDFSSKFQSSMQLSEYINDMMQNIPNFVPIIIGFWMN